MRNSQAEHTTGNIGALRFGIIRVDAMSVFAERYSDDEKGDLTKVLNWLLDVLSGYTRTTEL